MNADVDLYNGNGFSASTFRTDNWLASPGRKLRVACIGDSITAGLTIADSADFYPAQLQNILGTTNFEVQNFGKSSFGIYRATHRYDTTTEYANALAWQPDVVICNLGINDITTWGTYTQAQFETEYFELVDGFTQSGNAPLFIQWNNLAPLYPGQTFYGNANVVTLNQWIKEAATNTNTLTFDMETPLLGRQEWFPDNIHPNAAGAREIAETTFCLLDTLGDLDGQPSISEILTNNTSGLQDEDGDFSGWIELKNNGTSGASLSDNYLTNDLGNSTLWQIPSSTVIEPGNSLIVFASSKDKAVNAEELHTSFNLAPTGGDIALVDSDGSTVRDSLTAYPAQHANTSYGHSSTSAGASVSSGAALSYFVPTDSSLASSWTATSFDDSSWTSGANAVGYDNSVNIYTGAQIWDSSLQNGWAEANSAGVTKTLNGTVLHYDHTAQAVASALEGTNATLGGNTWDDINSGDWIFEIKLKVNASPNGFILWLGTDTHRVLVDIQDDRTTDLGSGTFTALHNNTDSAVHTFTISNDSAAQRYHVWRDDVLLTPAGGVTYDATAADSRMLFGDYAGASFGDGFDVEITSVSYSEGLYTSLIQTDVGTAIQSVNSSAYIRLPFTVASDPSDFTDLALNMQYDDGYVAYINGTEVARSNAPASQTWNSTASTDRTDNLALSSEAIDLTAH